MTVFSITSYLEEKGAKCEDALKEYFDALPEFPERLREVMEYSLFAGGKRLRPALAMGAAEIVCGSDESAVPAACALEMIHTYSLMHDDLPCMDDDDLRRGKPTAHKAYGEAMAILGGDGLLTMAFDLLAQAGNAEVVGELAQAAGVAGMAGGQVLDLQSEGKSLTLDQLRGIHVAKTGALICVSLRMGAMLAGANASQLDALTRFGDHIGLAFQIADDILDVVGSEHVLGKPVGSDEANHKATYPAVVGLERSRELSAEAVELAVEALHPFGPEADPLRILARYIIDREH